MGSKPTVQDVLNKLNRHDRLIEVMLHAIADHAIALTTILSNCRLCENRPITVINSITNITVCDRCCAESIVVQGEELVDWQDLPFADEVRRIYEHCNNVIEFDVVEH